MTKQRQHESGNVLFLILIAVALFAALSYAVTQSSRSGGGDANSEKNAVNSAQITQYPSGVRTALIRLMISSGYDVSELLFDKPSQFATTCTATPGPCVFHPSGGGATFMQGPANIMAAGTPADWIFSSAYEIDEIGTTTGDGSGSDLIAFLPGISLALCKKINSELGIGYTDDDDGNNVPDAGIAIADIPSTADTQDNDNSGIDTFVAAIDGPDLVGQAFGCADFNDTTAGTANGDLVYFHVLIER